MSNKPMFTPGPWEFEVYEQYEGAEKRFNIWQKEGAPYTPHYSDVAQTITGERLDIQEANARLIAAAPELLKALQSTQLLLCSLGLESSDEYQSNAATIAKALGEENV